DPCLLELFPAPLPERYIFRAQVQQQHNDAGEVGIYFAHHQQATRRGVEHCYCELVFNDWKDPPRWTQFHVVRRRVPGPLHGFSYAGSTGISKKIDVRPPGKLPWRTLKVFVTPEQTKVYWDGMCIGKYTCKDYVKRARLLFHIEPNPELD